MKSYDVAVVGSGPAGSFTACQLASRGYDVLVLESRNSVGEKGCCTGIVGRECFERFSCDDKVVLREAKSARIFSPSGKSIRVERDEVQAYIVDRPAFDRAMAQRAQKSGACYSLGCLVKDVTYNADGVIIHTERGGCRENIGAKVVVLATGFGSGLPARMGLGKVGDFVIGAQAEVRVDGLDEVEVYAGKKLAQGFFAWFVPLVGNRALAGLFSVSQQEQQLKQFISKLVLEGRITSDEYHINYGGVPLKPLSRTSAERVVVVGDAAGQVKPLTCGGIYYGLLCAEMASNVIHKAFEKGDFSANALAEYEKRWQKLLSRELKIGYWAYRLYGQFSDSITERLFDIIKSNGIDKDLAEDSSLSFDWHADFILAVLKHHALKGIFLGMKSWSPWGR
ncbi:MAG: NAD(P)/FAD-dependent oxidoreductase [Dehalococcoidia bacterium]|nr:NAD(P)/FAD-dependent oxidoreductase [Dehalococcoidia bacterium]